MAITINTSPSSINAAYSAINWNISSNDVNIKAIRADLYINGTYSTTVDCVQQLGSTSIFNVDVRKIMQSILVSELRSNITTFKVSDCVTSAASIKMRFYEILLSGGVYTTTWAANGAGTGYVESSTVKVVNISLQEDELLSDYTVDTSSKKLLTKRTGGEKIPRGVPFQVGFLGAVSLGAKYTTYDSNLNVIATATLSGANQITPSHGKGILEVPSSLFSSSNIAYIDLGLYDSGSIVEMSEIIRYKVEDYCNIIPVFNQNHLGDFDHFNFGAKKVVNANTSNQSLKRVSGDIIVNSNINERRQIYTAALSDKELLLLSEFIRNHTVTHYWKGANNFKRIKLVSHSTKIEDNSSLINQLSITYEPSLEWIAQKGD